MPSHLCSWHQAPCTHGLSWKRVQASKSCPPTHMALYLRLPRFDSALDMKSLRSRTWPSSVPHRGHLAGRPAPGCCTPDEVISQTPPLPQAEQMVLADAALPCSNTFRDTYKICWAGHGCCDSQVDLAQRPHLPDGRRRLVRDQQVGGNN